MSIYEEEDFDKILNPKFVNQEKKRTLAKNKRLMEKSQRIEKFRPCQKCSKEAVWLHTHYKKYLCNVHIEQEESFLWSDTWSKLDGTTID